MPIVSGYLDPQSRRSHLDVFTDEHANSRKFEKGLDYYKGQHKKFLEIYEQQPDDNTILNVVQVTADRTISFMFPEIPKFDFEDSTDTERFIQEAIDANGGLALLYKIGLSGLLSGHVFLLVQAGEQYPKISLIPYTQIKVYWKGIDMSVVYYALEWEEDGTKYVTDYIKEKESWKILTYKSGNGNAFELIESIKWNYFIPPIIEWQYLPNPFGYYGLSDVEDLRLQDTLNLIASEINRIVRYHSKPRVVATGTSSEDIVPTSTDAMWIIQESDARVELLEMKSDLQATRDYLLYIQNMYFQARRVVALSLSATDFQRVTNSGVRAVFHDMLSKRKLLLSPVTQGLIKLSLLIQYVGGKEPVKPLTILHSDPLPLDEGEIAKIELAKIEAMLTSRTSAARRMNMNWVEEMEVALLEKPVLDSLTETPLTDNNDGVESNNENSVSVDNKEQG